MASYAYDLFLRVADILLGWILFLPRDLALVAVALLTSLVLVLLRRWTTDQDMLAKAAADKKLLKARMKEAKQQGNRPERQRLTAVSQRIAMKRMKAEGKPLLVALIPIAILATWAFERLEFHPVMPGQTVQVELDMPLSSEGDVVHLVPEDGIEAVDGHVKLLERIESGEMTVICSGAVWRIRAQQEGRYRLLFRTDDTTYEHPLEVGTGKYAPVLQEHSTSRLTRSRVMLAELRSFGVVPGVPAAGLPAWMVGYLLITIVLFIISKKLLKVT